MIFQICPFVCCACAILRAVPTLLMSEGWPDVVLDDLVNCKFHVKKRPEGFISQTTAFNSCPLAFSPDMLASGLHTLMRSEIYLSGIWVSVMLLIELRKQHPICLQFVFLITQPCTSSFSLM